MNRLTYSAFVAFWSSVATLLAVAALSDHDVSREPAEQLPAFSRDELSEHSTIDSCWMAIEGRVYDLTDYIPDHPTPAAVLLPWCGTEATEAMRTKGYGRDHSAAAWAALDEYLIGTFNPSQPGN